MSGLITLTLHECDTVNRLKIVLTTGSNRHSHVNLVLCGRSVVTIVWLALPNLVVCFRSRHGSELRSTNVRSFSVNRSCKVVQLHLQAAGATSGEVNNVRMSQICLGFVMTA